MSKERKIKKLEIEIYKDQEETLNNYFLEVLIAAKNNETIPNESVLKIIDIISEVWESEDAYTFEIIRQVHERFKNYEFSNKKKVGDRFIKMNLKLLIEEIIILTKDKKYITPNDCVKDLIVIINNIHKHFLNSTAKKFITPYKRQAIVGFIAMRYGFTLFPNPSDKLPTASEISYRVYEILRYKKKGEK